MLVFRYFWNCQKPLKVSYQSFSDCTWFFREFHFSLTKFLTLCSFQGSWHILHVPSLSTFVVSDIYSTIAYAHCQYIFFVFLKLFLHRLCLFLGLWFVMPLSPPLCDSLTILPSTLTLVNCFFEFFQKFSKNIFRAAKIT